jgi:hypothetical protein
MLALTLLDVFPSCPCEGSFRAVIKAMGSKPCTGDGKTEALAIRAARRSIGKSFGTKNTIIILDERIKK